MKTPFLPSFFLFFFFFLLKRNNRNRVFGEKMTNPRLPSFVCTVKKFFFKANFPEVQIYFSRSRKNESKAPKKRKLNRKLKPPIFLPPWSFNRRALFSSLLEEISEYRLIGEEEARRGRRNGWVSKLVDLYLERDETLMESGVMTPPGYCVTYFWQK